MGLVVYRLQAATTCTSSSIASSTTPWCHRTPVTALLLIFSLCLNISSILTSLLSGRRQAQGPRQDTQPPLVATCYPTFSTCEPFLPHPSMSTQHSPHANHFSPTRSDKGRWG